MESNNEYTKAYIIGLLAADGGYNVSKKIYERFCFYTSEEYQANNISKHFNCKIRKRVRDISLNGYEYINNISYEVEIPSIHVKELKKYGIITKKTNRVISGIPKNLMYSYILGFLDGDGSIIVRHRKDCRKPRLNVHIVSGAEKILIQIQRFLEDENISSSIYQRKEKCFELRINNTNSSIKFCNSMYNILPKFFNYKKNKIFKDYLKSCVQSDELLEGSNEIISSQASSTLLEGSETT